MCEEDGMEEWKEYKLGDIIKIKHGYAFEGKSISFEDNNIVLVTPGNFAIGGGFQEKKCKFFHSSYPSEYILKENDLIVTMTDLSKDGDTLGYSAKVPYSDTRIYLHNQRIGLVQFINSEVDKDFIYWFMRSPLYQKTVLSTSSGSTVKHTSPDRICGISVKLPPLPTQQKIAAILSSLDDKIELNNKINTNLEQQAGALFKNWFVDFEPFGGKMPEGWKVGKLSEIGTIVGGSTPSKAKKEYYTNKGIAWITPKDLSNDKSKFISHGEIDITELGFKNSSAIKMPKGTVLYSSRAPIGYIAISKNEVTTNQGFKSVIPNPNVGNAYIYYFLRSNFELIDNMASGSTFKEISGTAMKNVPVLIPDDKTLFNFQTMCETLFLQQELLENENVTLSTIRDTLLSKLMNGEIEVGIK